MINQGSQEPFFFAPASTRFAISLKPSWPSELGQVNKNPEPLDDMSQKRCNYLRPMELSSDISSD